MQDEFFRLLSTLHLLINDMENIMPTHVSWVDELVFLRQIEAFVALIARKPTQSDYVLIAYIECIAKEIRQLCDSIIETQLNYDNSIFEYYLKPRKSFRRRKHKITAKCRQIIASIVSGV